MALAVMGIESNDGQELNYFQFLNQSSFDSILGAGPWGRARVIVASRITAPSFSSAAILSLSRSESPVDDCWIEAIEAIAAASSSSSGRSRTDCTNRISSVSG